jgi:hypothetical protein
LHDGFETAEALVGYDPSDERAHEFRRRVLKLDRQQLGPEAPAQTCGRRRVRQVGAAGLCPQRFEQGVARIRCRLLFIA